MVSINPAARAGSICILLSSRGINAPAIAATIKLISMAEPKIRPNELSSNNNETTMPVMDDQRIPLNNPTPVSFKIRCR